MIFSHIWSNGRRKGRVDEITVSAPIGRVDLEALKRPREAGSAFRAIHSADAPSLSLRFWQRQSLPCFAEAPSEVEGEAEGAGNDLDAPTAA